MNKASIVYGSCRERISEIATNLDPEDLTRKVPACPEWTITDLVALLVGVAEDFADGNFDNRDRTHGRKLRSPAARSRDARIDLRLGCRLEATGSVSG